jgi:uracil-DNA glycosylase family 4
MATTLPRALPHLDERQTAMLAEMGIAPWWAPRALLPQPRVATAAAERAPEPPVLPRPRAATPATPPAVPPASPSQPAAGQPPAVPSAPVHPHAAAALDIDALDWDALHAAIHACQRCALAGCRQRAVPGVGDRRPDWLIVGEAPGEEEDRQGEPFVGRAGQLLDRMLAAMGLRRGQGVYIANVIKCRPPRNRNPEPDEIARCTPYLLRQIALLQPRLVLAMGRFAAQTLLAEGGCDAPDTLLRTPLGRLRGRVYTARLAGLALPVVVTYHPAYLLRNPADKAKAWADLCLALDTAEALPARGRSGGDGG